jgi:SAM-dependent methyltransferase
MPVANADHMPTAGWKLTVRPISASASGIWRRVTASSAPRKNTYATVFASKVPEHEKLHDVPHRLPFADRSVALVTSRACPHHFHSIQVAVNEMAGVLTRGGRLGIADGTVPDDPEIDAFVNALDVLHDPTTVRNYSGREWRGFYEAAGLRVDSVADDVFENDEGMSLADWLARSGASSVVFDEARAMLLGAATKIQEYLRVRDEGEDVRFDLPRCVIVGKRVD